MKAYPQYKASGIDWLGQIPSHWKVTKFKYFLEQISKPSTDTNKVALENIEPGSGKYLSTSTMFDGNGVEFHKGDIVYGKLRPYLRKVWLAEFDGNAVGDFYVYRVTHLCFNHYIKWLFLSSDFTNVINQSTDGAKMPRVSADFIKGLVFYLPPVAEQEAIAGYLDEVCGKIDALVAEKHAQVDELRAYRTSLITETVTRGLNPDAPLRPSGIDWLGDIPQHWEIIKTAWLFDNIGSGTTPISGADEYYKDGTVNWLQTGDLNDGIITETSKKVTEYAVQSRGLKLYPKGSLVIAMYGATIAKLGLLDIYTTVNQACCVLGNSDKIISKYGFYFFYAAKGQLISLASGGGQPNISQAIIYNLKVVVPPLSEQKEIAEFLDAKTVKIDEAICELEAQLKDLVDYKQAVITEAVTGKVDVRDWKPKE